MHHLLEKLTRSASDAGEFVRGLAESGVQSVHQASASLAGLRIFSALNAHVSEDVARDETHYILVPSLREDMEFELYSKRVLPPDVGTTNSLTKARVFHVPDEAATELLEEKLLAQLMDKNLDPQQGDSQLADSIDDLAKKIDQETAKISGGLILIGGVVAIANPLLGVGIAAKALLPTITSTASKTGAEFLAGKLRKRAKSSHLASVESAAKKEIKQLKPEIVPNALLRSLDAVLTQADSNYDPALDETNWIDSFAHIHHYTIAKEAIREVYQDQEKRIKKQIKSPAHQQWVLGLLEEG